MGDGKRSRNRVQIALKVVWVLVLVCSVFAVAITVRHTTRAADLRAVLQEHIEFARRVVQPGLEETFDNSTGIVLRLANTWLDALGRISDLTGMTVLLAILGLILQRIQARSVNKKNGDGAQGREDHS